MNEWFVKLTKTEIAAMDTETQCGVYRSIKSFCGNGTLSVALSHRDIASRTKIDRSFVPQVLIQLTVRGLIKVVGKQGRRGGMVDVYQVATQSPVTDNQVASESPVERGQVATQSPVSPKSSGDWTQSSGDWTRSSGDSVGIKRRQTNNIIKKLTKGQLWNIACDLRVGIHEVVKIYRDVLDPANVEKYHTKDIAATLRNWTRRRLESKTLEELDPLGMQVLEAYRPTAEEESEVVA